MTSARAPAEREHPRILVAVIAVVAAVASVGLFFGILLAYIAVAGDPGAPIGIMRDGRRVEVLAQLCAGDTLTKVTVSRMKDEGFDQLDVGDRIWQVSAWRSTVNRFVIGEAPPGWQTDLAIDAEDLPNRFEIAIHYAGGPEQTQIYDAAGEYERNRVLYQGRFETEADFFGKHTRSRCG